MNYKFGKLNKTMRLTNYKRGYNDIFDCSIHGTIYMTRAEYDELVPFLYQQFATSSTQFEKDILYGDLARRIDIYDKRGKYTGFYINVRVPLTEKIAEKYELRNYKRGNYQLYIKE